ncbi:hypothetical protein FOC1_g10008830 [Fusarium oxysporum f. sp. cubense race 1]|uniref:Uncharacterized protein n=1 Tax=Fusarium oxysporum f. sp. cubense (strain race 1) TaxID=1229664 RepID=N4UT85_FUSC1|nr:hypothetical protein FOC1_g10008830 [Fusarium oxysporum f. sp. cubense race 1]
MAELALAIVPLGITVTSGLIKYLKTFKGHDDDRARLLSPELFISASEACGSLGDCQKALEELDTLQENIFAPTTSAVATTPHARTKGKIKDGYKKLLYPLRKDEESLTRKILNEQMVEIQKNTVVNSSTSAAIKELHQPISRIDLAVPVLQTSVDAIVPHFDQRFDQISYQISYQYFQMQAQIKSLLDMAGPARYQDHLGTSQQPSYNHSGEQGNYIAARETEQELLVDKDVAPAFLVMSLLLDAIKLKNINETRSRVILNAAQRKLHELFCSGRASPNDVTQDSSTLLHSLGFTAYHWLTTLQGANSPFVRLTCEALVNFLVAAGTSVTVRDRYGVRALLDYYDHNQSVASSLRHVTVQYGPLSLAVIRNNLQEVERLVSLHAHMLKEVALDTVAQRWDSKLDGLNDLVQISTCEEAIQETRDSLKEGDEEEIFNRIIQQIQDI